MRQGQEKILRALSGLNRCKASDCAQHGDQHPSLTLLVSFSELRCLSVEADMVVVLNAVVRQMRIEFRNVPHEHPQNP